MTQHVVNLRRVLWEIIPIMTSVESLSLKHSSAYGHFRLLTTFGKQEDLKEKLVARLTGVEIGVSRYLRSKSMNRMKLY